jgi:hypothetical protein
MFVNFNIIAVIMCHHVVFMEEKYKNFHHIHLESKTNKLLKT